MARSNYTMDEKQTHVELWEESGLSKQKYCDESGITYMTPSKKLYIKI